MRSVILIAAMILWVAGCSNAPRVPCVGKVVEKYTSYEQGVVINTGGNNSGGVGIPVGGGTRYHLAIERSDGETCSRKVKKQVWLSSRVGSEWPPEVTS